MGVEIGQIIDGKYRVLALIGEGGMGAVFAGEHLRLHRKVAIKVLHAVMARDAEVVRRFEREAQAAGRIGNDHILEVMDIGELPSGERFMVMEFLEGEPMNGRLERFGRLTPRQVYPLAREILEGLAAAHVAGIVHRDLKPANIFILREKAGRADYVKIIDFGISKFQNVGGDEQKTRTGLIIGTPLYMSPEQARGLSEADSRTDLYALGVILYESVTGRVPFNGASPTDLLFQIALSTPPPIQSLVNDVDPAFCSIVEKAMARDPSGRFATAGEFIAALDAWAQRGQGVAVPVPAPAAPMPAYPRTAQLGPPATTSSTTAPGTPWASSQAIPATPPARRTGLVLGVLTGVVVLVGLVATLLLLRSRGTVAAARVAPTVATSATSVAPSTTTPEPTSVAAPSATASSQVVALEPEAPPPAASAPAAASSSPRPSPVGAAVPPARRPAERPAASPAPTPTGYNPFGHL